MIHLVSLLVVSSRWPRKLLIGSGADVNVLDRHGSTPLFFVPSAEACQEPPGPVSLSAWM